MTYRCDDESQFGACEAEDGTFEHRWSRNAPTLDGRAINGCVRVIPEAGIDDAPSPCDGHDGSVPAVKLGQLLAVETDRETHVYRGASLWTDASGHRLFIRGGAENPRRAVASSAALTVEQADVLYFHRPSCTTCRDLRATVDELAGYVAVLKLDADRHRDLAEKYGVRGVPTLVQVRAGKKIGIITQARRVVALLRRSRATCPT